MIRVLSIGAHIILASLLLPGLALAVQEHGAPEGIYSHQGAHVFFAASMGLLIFWLRQRRLVREPGWRCIQYAALFFILWNIDAFTAHFLDEQSGVLDTVMAAPGKLKSRWTRISFRWPGCITWPSWTTCCAFRPCCFSMPG